MPMRKISVGGRPVTSLPAKTMLPACGRTIPNTVLSSVDLPAPLAPMMDTMCPACTRSDTPRSTSTSAYPARTSVSASSVGSAAKVRLDDVRVAADRLRRALGDLLAVIEHDDALGDVHDHLHVVLDQKHGFALPMQLEDVGLHLIDHRGIHRRGRLVEQEQVGVGHERGREREELALPVGEGAGAGLGSVRQADEVEQP